MRQLIRGPRDNARLNGIMHDLHLAKGSLILKIQVAHVGLTRSVGDAVLVNCEIVERVNAVLQQILGEGKGLRIADLLRDGVPQGAYSGRVADKGHWRAQVIAALLTSCVFQLTGRYGSTSPTYILLASGTMMKPRLQTMTSF